jgi:hypothetical protein
MFSAAQWNHRSADVKSNVNRKRLPRGHQTREKAPPEETLSVFCP